LFQFGAEIAGSAHLAHDVITYVSDDRLPRLEREHSVERSHAVNLGWSHIETFGNVVHRAGADPANRSLDSMQRGQEPVALGMPGVSIGTRDGCAQFRIDGSLFFRGGARAGKVKVQSVLGPSVQTSFAAAEREVKSVNPPRKRGEHRLTTRARIGLYRIVPQFVIGGGGI
jgi:hypothetical protein